MAMVRVERHNEAAIRSAMEHKLLKAYQNEAKSRISCMQISPSGSKTPTAEAQASETTDRTHFMMQSGWISMVAAGSGMKNRWHMETCGTQGHILSTNSKPTQGTNNGPNQRFPHKLSRLESQRGEKTQWGLVLGLETREFNQSLGPPRSQDKKKKGLPGQILKGSSLQELKRSTLQKR